MGRLRARPRQEAFSGFTNGENVDGIIGIAYYPCFIPLVTRAMVIFISLVLVTFGKIPIHGFLFLQQVVEVDKLERLFEKSGEEMLSREFCRKVALSFTRSAGRAGKPIVKWDEVQSWFQKRKEEGPRIVPSSSSPKNDAVPPASNKANDDSNAPKGQTEDFTQLYFEAKSSKDGAWYDVDMFLAHRFLNDGDINVRVRFVGFGSEEDEWVNLRKSVRQRSIPLENSDCKKVKPGDLVLCFQERRDQARYYDARIMEIQRRVHDIRGCRCLFLIRFDHDNSEESVRLRKLCRRA